MTIVTCCERWVAVTAKKRLPVSRRARRTRDLSRRSAPPSCMSGNGFLNPEKALEPTRLQATTLRYPARRTFGLIFLTYSVKTLRGLTCATLDPGKARLTLFDLYSLRGLNAELTSCCFRHTPGISHAVTACICLLATASGTCLSTQLRAVATCFPPVCNARPISRDWRAICWLRRCRCVS